MTQSKAFLAVLMTCAVAVTLLSCDPEKDALAIFTHQGLVLLQPARDYIKVGGIVVLPKHGGPEYLDPFDQDVASDPTTYVDFKAVILGQTKDQSSGLEAALSGLASLMPLSAKLSYKGGQTVQLSQIDTGGRRILTKTVNSLLKEKTGDELRTLLGEPGNKYRVFVVQEVYTGKSVTLKTASNKSLDVAYGTGGSLPDCSSPKDSGSSTGRTAANSPNQSTSTGTTSSTSAAKEPTSSSEVQALASKATSRAPSVLLGACKNGDFALTLQSQESIPFAVRLNEILLSNGILSVKYGDFQFPPNSLASGEEVEKATAVLDPDALSNVRRRPHERQLP
ncbi:MAG TPA: hypothetical protein VEI80_03645 [Candidatus Acidoferrales bacterium]|nr:hypothetical protein [Candidatus Acidoferrales bacterium]